MGANGRAGKYVKCKARAGECVRVHWEQTARERVARPGRRAQRRERRRDKDTACLYGYSSAPRANTQGRVKPGTRTGQLSENEGQCAGGTLPTRWAAAPAAAAGTRAAAGTGCTPTPQPGSGSAFREEDEHGHVSNAPQRLTRVGASRRCEFVVLSCKMTQQDEECTKSCVAGRRTEGNERARSRRVGERQRMSHQHTL